VTEYEERLVSAVTKFETMSSDIASIKGTMERVADAITRLAVVEERQVQTNGAITRAFNELDKHEGRIRTLEDAQPLQKQTSNWVDRAVTIVMTAVITAVVSMVVVKAGDPARLVPALIAPK
jgi:hypothetical protein